MICKGSGYTYQVLWTLPPTADFGEHSPNLKPCSANGNTKVWVFRWWICRNLGVVVQWVWGFTLSIPDMWCGFQHAHFQQQTTTRLMPFAMALSSEFWVYLLPWYTAPIQSSSFGDSFGYYPFHGWVPAALELSTTPNVTDAHVGCPSDCPQSAPRYVAKLQMTGSQFAIKKCSQA